VLTVGREAEVLYEALQLRRGALTIHGVGATWTGCEQAQRRLAALGLSARLERKEELQDGRVAFVMSTEGER
jgi:hypothetical protein